MLQTRSADSSLYPNFDESDTPDDCDYDSDEEYQTWKMQRSLIEQVNKNLFLSYDGIDCCEGTESQCET